jgi:mutator protein MutT
MVPVSAGVRIHVVAAVVQRRGRFLLCRRPSHKRHGGCWEFPGGKVHPGESLADAARRELAEELGVSVTMTGRVHASIPDPGSVFIVDFLEVAVRGRPVLTEHSALAWVELAQLATLQMAPSDRQFADWLATQPRVRPDTAGARPAPDRAPSGRRPRRRSRA